MSFEKIREISRNLTRNYNDFSDFSFVLGPCAVENEGQIEAAAISAREFGARYLRGGAVKLRTQHTSFEGLGQVGWEMLGRMARKHSLSSVSEVTSAADVAFASQHIDILQVGARCMWDFELLMEAGRSGLPVVLKRGLGANTIEWLSAANRLQFYGCKNIILCERGFRSINDGSRNTVDLSVLAFLVDEIPLPVWLDVSHSAGDPKVSLSLFKRGKSFGLAGVMAEIHPDPSTALCDKEQAIATSTLLNLNNSYD